MNDKYVKVGTYNQSFNDLLGLNFEIRDIYRSKGLPTHMVKKGHYKALKYIDYIPDIITSPDYIGINPNESEDSIELIKKYKDNILIGIKLDKENDCYYVSTMHDIQSNKIPRRLHSNRIKPFTNN